MTDLHVQIVIKQAPEVRAMHLHDSLPLGLMLGKQTSAERTQRQGCQTRGMRLLVNTHVQGA